MPKFQNFTVTEILREISFGECRNAKTPIFAILEALNFVDWVYLSLQKSGKIHIIQSSDPLNLLK